MVNPAETHGPIVVRRRLGARLKQHREAANIRLEKAASQIECSTSKLSRLEHGQGIPRAIEVSALLDFYGVVDTKERTRILMWTEKAKATTWWQSYSDAIASDLELYISLEAEAQLVRTFSAGPLSGLLQTAEYARATIEPHFQVNRQQLASLVEVRMKRQSVLDRVAPVPFRLEFIVAEEALFKRVGPPGVMRRQLTNLIEMSERDSVDIAVLPIRASRARAKSTFTIFTPIDDADWEVVNEEGSVSDQWFETAPRVDAFRSIWDDLRRKSLKGDAARKTISEVVRAEYDSDDEEEDPA
jgi:transcriptional regulator with XRE-family HTH domain